MNEAARVQLLDAIGIVPLVPRFVLPGAKPSPQCDTTGLYLAEALAPQPAPTPAVAGDAAARPKAPRVEPDTAPATRDIRPAKNAAQSAIPQPAGELRVETAAAQRLQVGLIQHHARCFSLLPIYRADFQQEAEQFLRAVMAALGIQSPLLAPQVFRWPFANNAKLDQGPAALREALGGFVRHAAREPDSVVLLWGLDLARHLREDAVAQPCEFALSTALRAIAAHRVQDYFNEPLRKRELWRQLCALRPLLKDGVA